MILTSELCTTSTSMNHSNPAILLSRALDYSQRSPRRSITIRHTHPSHYLRTNRALLIQSKKASTSAAPKKVYHYLAWRTSTTAFVPPVIALALAGCPSILN
ncbi:hypothetical protein BDR07DRAFT_589946 [Suillus spraguei]|nr:hypothetical protein BDR07DRAFT_589946 [Suillus spraguei]